MSTVKQALLAQHEAQDEQREQGYTDDSGEDRFYVDAEKFKKMIRAFSLMRNLQTKYFETKNHEVLKKALAVETKIDKALLFYKENEDKLHSCPF